MLLNMNIEKISSSHLSRIFIFCVFCRRLLLTSCCCPFSCLFLEVGSVIVFGAVSGLLLTVEVALILWVGLFGVLLWIPAFSF